MSKDVVDLLLFNGWEKMGEDSYCLWRWWRRPGGVIWGFVNCYKPHMPGTRYTVRLGGFHTYEQDTVIVENILRRRLS